MAKVIKKVSKLELVKLMAVKNQITQKEAEKHLNEVLDIMTEVLLEKQNITLNGFGTFSVIKRKAHTAHNPGTGEEIKVPAHNVITFKIARKIKEAIKAPPTKRVKK